MYIIHRRHRIYESVDSRIIKCKRIVEKEMRKIKLLKDPMKDLDIKVLTLSETRDTNLDYFGGAYFIPRMDEEGEESFEIGICEDIEAVFSDDWKPSLRNLYVILENMDIPINKLTMFTFTLVHEFGHFYLYSLITKMGMQKELSAIRSFSEGIGTMLSDMDKIEKWKQKFGINIVRFFDWEETNCDLFAARQFPKIWKKMKREKELNL